MNEPDEYLNWINNDIILLIGVESNTKLSNELDKLMKNKNNIDIHKISKLLMDVPLYFLLSFLGYATYKESLN